MNLKPILRLIVSLTAVACFLGCSNPTTTTHQFELLRKDVTGLDFVNKITMSPDFNPFNYMYFYNGGGVGVGDFNNDGKQDLFFCSNMGHNKMFLNQGGFRFKDVSDSAGISGMEGWTSGVSVVDINNDGLLDLYVSQIGEYETLRGKNQLFVCQKIENGIPEYLDEAHKYGLDLVGFSTQASFFDYDLDGDLDMYQLNYSLHQNGTFGMRKTFMNTYDPKSGDKLLRNDNGHFTDVTRKSKIISTVVGYGLGIVTGDINNDGWPDIYIGNDFHENDYLYINQHDGTFKEELTSEMTHTSRFSMGVDMADVNNDGLDDIISLDMLPYDPKILKMSLGEDTYEMFHFKLGYGYNEQFARNNLQLNNGDGSFTEIGLYAGVEATDWSWTPLFMDFDHDGYKDLFVSNGIMRRMNDIDFLNYRQQHQDFKWKSQLDNLETQDLSAINVMPTIKLPNRFFLNNHHLRFKEISNEVLNDESSYSNGAAYADFDNDGDLDIVVNNNEDEPFIYKNNEIENRQDHNGYLAFDFIGSPQNINGIGTKVVVFESAKQIIYENFPIRGYQSSVQLGLNVGVGDTASVDSVIVIWPDQSYERLNLSGFRKKYVLKWSDNLPKFDFSELKHPRSSIIPFEDITSKTKLNYKHKENPFVEYDREHLIPYEVSREGPALAIGDINGDGLEDVFVGGSKRKMNGLFIQNVNGQFEEDHQPILMNDSIFEDVDATFSDLDNDGDLDLIVASGGNEYWPPSEYLKQRIYINDGKGQFVKKIYLPNALMTASCVAASDFNHDGLIDLFFGGRAVPRRFGEIPSSYLFINKGGLQFEDATDQVASGLKNIGMVKDATWVDIDKDSDMDLLLVIDWRPLTLFINDKGVLKKHEINHLNGWWNFAYPYDLDSDGDIDLLAGNIGENSKFRPSKRQPVRLYVEDFDNNGQLDQILTYYVGGREIPFANYTELTTQLPALKRRFPLAKELAEASLKDLFGEVALEEATIFEVDTTSSMWFENDGNSNFTPHRLPDELQYSSLQSAAIVPGIQGGATRLVVGGNFYDVNIEMGRYDASYGDILSIDKNGSMKTSPLGNLKIDGQVRSIKPIMINDQRCYLIARNNDSLMIIKPSNE